MTTLARLAPDVSVTAHRGTLYITWANGSTSTEDEDEVGPLLLSCRRQQPVEGLIATHGKVLVERVLQEGLIIPVDGGAVELHHSTVTAGSHAGTYTGQDDFRAADDRRLLREYGGGDGVDLPEPDPVSSDLTALLEARSSARAFSGRPLTRANLSTLLATALGLQPGSARPRIPGGPPCRPGYPSPGALYPVEVGLVLWRGGDLDAAAYRYQPLGHRLLRTGVVEGTDATALVGPTPGGPSGLVVLWCDLAGPTFVKYGTKGYRLMLLEAGHVMQNLVLVAQAMHLAALPVAGFRDAEVASVLGLDKPEQAPVYGLLVGAAP